MEQMSWDLRPRFAEPGSLVQLGHGHVFVREDQIEAVQFERVRTVVIGGRTASSKFKITVHTKSGGTYTATEGTAVDAVEVLGMQTEAAAYMEEDWGSR